MSEKLRELMASIHAYPDVTLVAVSKAVGPEKIERAYHCGIRHFGENRVQDALLKMAQCNLPIAWHFVGRLQTNKVRKVLDKFFLIHSLCSKQLAEEASRVAQAEGQVVSFLVQVDSSEEATKQGLSPDEVWPFMQYVSGLPGVSVQGLMTIGPNTTDKALISKGFRQVRALYDELSKYPLPAVEMRYLSMGMSADYQLALAAGSNMVRIGTAVFAHL
ncbi:MAG: hypothetical protein DDT35_00890 [Firmicutes bacterium]|nr:hypothetical protein [Bacillota bacterium]